VRPKIVFVHGAWHGAWCWEPVQQRLRAHGVDSVAIDLPGHGNDSGRLTDLHGDSDALRRVLDREPADSVVLVGHSYGGAVITDAGVHAAVRELVYVTAYALAEGESLVDAAKDEAEAHGVAAVAPALLEGMTIHDDGTSTLSDEVVANTLYNACDEATRSWAIQHVGPQSLAISSQSPRAIAWRTVRSTYVVCAQDRAILPEFQRILARRCTETVGLPADHSPFASTPEALTDLLVGIIERTP
jgi:pimeloyl-ACP methyl ester carboxylesterase